MSEYELEIGRIATIYIKNQSHLGVILKEIPKPPFKCLEAVPNDSFIGEYQQLLAAFIANYYCVNLGLSYGLFTPFVDKKSQQNLQDELDLSKDSHIKDSRDLAKDSSNLQKDSSNICDIQSSLNPLTPKQLEALQFIQTHDKTLLFGDTGSGKTEIYIHAILDTLKSGRNAIFLIPEIALTPQMEKRLRSAFGDLVCIWHSKISKKRKNEILEQIWQNKIRIIVGARSALFLPLSNLGLLIIDEEHDDAYKSSSNPRYNARDISIYLATKAKIKLILGSATPSPNSYFNFHKNGEIFRLKGRHFESTKSIIFESSSTQISSLLIQKISQSLQAGKQIIVFVPIRANFKTILCLSCGNSIQCPNCSISLSSHSKRNALICHYCGYTQAIPKQCPNCGNDELSALKIGTQEVAKELSEIFENAKIAVFDRDEITTEAKLRKILNDFNDKKIDILIGTQMLSKGHDYHNVALAVILGIDYLLYGGDFRSFERTMSLFYQIAGRCARKESGEVFIQTLNRAFFERFSDDYEDFLRYELSQREGFYPPFRRLALITSTHRDEKIAKERIESCKNIVESCKNIEIVGVNRAPIERIGGKWRYFMLLRGKNYQDILKALYMLKGKAVSIDIDPLQLL